MSRLGIKCIIATAGLHLLLLTILLVGPAFFAPKPKEDDTQILDVIPANLLDAALNSGVRNATPPQPQPVVQPAPQPTPPAPVPVVQPTPQPPAPSPTLVERLEKIFKHEPAKPATNATPIAKNVKSEPHKIQINTQLVARSSGQKNSTTKTKPDNSAKANANAVNNAVTNLRGKLAPGTVIDVPGTGSVSSANYRDTLASIYYNAWTTPEGATDDDANAIVRITIASDGTVINAHIITPSGDAKVDESVRRTLTRVQNVPPLPDQSKTQQDFTIAFNLQTKRMSE